MKKYWVLYRPVVLLLIVWCILLWFIEVVSPFFIPQRIGYIGPIPWANFDGVLYLKIVEEGYYKFSQAFFPLYPMLISGISRIIPFPSWIHAVSISLVCFSVGLCLLYGNIYEKNKRWAWWTIVFIVAFPTSFFFNAVYTEGLFFLLSILVYIFAEKRKWFLCGIFGALASATRLFGVLLLVYVLIEYICSKPSKVKMLDILSILLIPFGLLCYMTYLYIFYNDPLLFFHLQPLFGAHRTGDSFILLPQVIWRYGKILFTAFLQPTPISYFVSVLEMVATFFGYAVLWFGWKMKERWSLVLYGMIALTLPTLTGTFSSVPRYLLCIFPLFLILGKLDNTVIRYILLFIFIFLQIILSSLFLRGWFVS